MAQARAHLDADDGSLDVVGLRTEAPGVVTLTLAVPSGDGLAFDAGQFVTIEVPLGTGAQWRCFTIASAPGTGDVASDRIEITVKRHGAGGATDWLHAHARPGLRLAARPIAGEFAMRALPAGPVALVSAGSGATPTMSMLRWLHARGHDGDMEYLHFGRTDADLLFRDEVERIAAGMDRMRATFATSAAHGRPGPADILARLPGLGACEVYCCGPAGFMDTVRAAHREAGGRPERFHEESFGAPALDLAVEACADAVPGAAPAFRVTLSPSGATFPAAPGETILVAATRAGIVIPSSCRQGLCATCRVRKVEGEAEMHQNGGLFDDEVEEGAILACCTYPRSAMTIAL